MKKILFALFAVLTVSSCSFLKDVQVHSSVDVVAPKAKFQPLTVTAKFWEIADLTKKYAPVKLTDAIKEAEKYCTIKLLSFPVKNGNDTLAIQLKCDTATERIASLFKK